MPSTPKQRARVVPVLLLSGAMVNWVATGIAAEPTHPAHARGSKNGDAAGKPIAEPALVAKPGVEPALVAKPPPPTAPTPPAGPLTSQAVLVAHGEASLVESVARAGSRLVAVGVNGLVLLSDDDGLSWRQVQPPVQATLTGVLFLDDSVGWAIGHYGVVLRTEDAGETWSLMLDAPRAAQITLESALAANGSDTARQKAIDAARRLGEFDPSRPFLLMQAEGPDTLRVIGTGGMALETEDAGRHWHPWSTAIDNPDALPLLGSAQRDGVMLVDGAKGILLAGRPADGLSRLHSPADSTFFGALDAGRFGFLLFGQQGNAFTGDLAQPATATRADGWRQVDTPTQNSFTAGLLKRDGTALLGDSAGMVWLLGGRPDEPRLETAAARAPSPILSMAEAADGALILAGGFGLQRVEPPAPPAPVVTPVLATVPAAVAAPGPGQSAGQTPSHGAVQGASQGASQGAAAPPVPAAATPQAAPRSDAPTPAAAPAATTTTQTVPPDGASTTPSRTAPAAHPGS